MTIAFASSTKPSVMGRAIRMLEFWPPLRLHFSEVRGRALAVPFLRTGDGNARQLTWSKTSTVDLGQQRLSGVIGVAHVIASANQRSSCAISLLARVESKNPTKCSTRK